MWRTGVLGVVAGGEERSGLKFALRFGMRAIGLAGSRGIRCVGLKRPYIIQGDAAGGTGLRFVVDLASYMFFKSRA